MPYADIDETGGTPLRTHAMHEAYKQEQQRLQLLGSSPGKELVKVAERYKMWQEDGVHVLPNKYPSHVEKGVKHYLVLLC